MKATPFLIFKDQKCCLLHLGNPCRLLYSPAPHGTALTHLDQDQAGQVLLPFLPEVFLYTPVFYLWATQQEFLFNTHFRP